MVAFLAGFFSHYLMTKNDEKHDSPKKELILPEKKNLETQLKEVAIKFRGAAYGWKHVFEARNEDIKKNISISADFLMREAEKLWEEVGEKRNK